MPPNNGNSDLVLYYHPFSFYSQKVVMSLHIKKLKFRLMSVDIGKGRQFSDKYLSLNPRGEVPVLVDEVKVIPGSEHIINYIEDNFANGIPRLRPIEFDLRGSVDQMSLLINELKIDALTFGSVMHDDDDLEPRSPYDNVAYRAQVKSLGLSRAKVLESEIIKHPNHADALRKKLNDVQEEDILWQDRRKYLDVILSFEKVLDECEAELQSHRNNQWWLCSPEISVADVSLSILLHRIRLLGFERRMLANRPYLCSYFARVQQLDSFKEAISMKDKTGFSEIFSSPVFWVLVGAIAIAGGGWFLYKARYHGSQGHVQEIVLPPLPTLSSTTANVAKINQDDIFSSYPELVVSATSSVPES